MSFLNVNIGLNFGSGTVNNLVGDIKKITSVSYDAGKSIASIGAQVGILSKMQGFAAIGAIGQNAANSIKLLGSEIKSTVSFFSGYAAQGDKIAKTSRMVGLSVKEYQAFSSAANHAGMSTEEMDKSLQRFNINLGKAKSGDAKSLKMFDALLGGKSVSDFKDSSSLLATVADGYTKLGSAETKAFVFSSCSKRAPIRCPLLKYLILCGFASELALKKSEKFDEIFTFWPNFGRLSASKMAVDFVEFPVCHAKKTDCRARTDGRGDSRLVHVPVLAGGAISGVHAALDF